MQRSPRQESPRNWSKRGQCRPDLGDAQYLQVHVLENLGDVTRRVVVDIAELGHVQSIVFAA